MNRIISKQIDVSGQVNSASTLEQIEAMIALDDYAIMRVVGDCMSGADIDDSDYVGVCFTKFPRPPQYKRNMALTGMTLVFAGLHIKASHSPE